MINLFFQTVVRNTSDFFMLILYPATSLKLFIYPNSSVCVCEVFFYISLYYLKIETILLHLDDFYFFPNCSD